MTLSAIGTGRLVFILLFLFCGVSMLIFYIRNKKPFPSALKGMLSGGLSLIAVHFLGGSMGFYIPLNFFTSAVSLILGAPGVIIMALAEKHGLL